MKENSNITYRKASLKDIPFLIETIIEAEKSGTKILSYSTIFGLTEDEIHVYLAKMLQEEIDGCELSISSFLLAEKENETVAAIAAWIEGVDGIPSTILKGNLLNYSLPKECLERAIKLNPLIRELHIDYIAGTLQIGLVFVRDSARGQNLAGTLIELTISEYKKEYPALHEVYVQVFSNNIFAINAYEKAGFSICYTKSSSFQNAVKFMPFDSKVLMRKEIN